MSHYPYDPYMQVKETSPCGRRSGPLRPQAIYRSGRDYHLHLEYLSRIDAEHNWDRVVNHSLSGYRASKAQGGVFLPDQVTDSFAYKHMIETHQFQLWAPAFQFFVDADVQL